MKCHQCAGTGKEFDIAHDGFDYLNPWIKCDVCNGTGAVIASPTCRSCGVPFADHLGLEPTCERLMAIKRIAVSMKCRCRGKVFEDSFQPDRCVKCKILEIVQ